MTTTPAELLTFPQWLKRRRGALGWTQADLAEAVSCALVTVKRIENGSLRPSLQLATLLAEKLAVPPAEQAHFLTFARAEEAAVPHMAFWPATPTAVSALRPLALPALLTPTIGREAEIAAVSALLRQPTVRLLTLTGPPGTGKTRLSIEIAHALAPEFANGVCFVPLAAVRDDDCLLPALVQALNLPEDKAQNALDQLANYLGQQQILLVLDNFEQLVPFAHHLTELLGRVPHLKLLISSREWLNCYGEYEFPVSPLALPNIKALPPLEKMGDYSAVTLFLGRARLANPNFVLDETTSPIVAHICTQLDGLPLAIEMAAARLRRATAAQIQAQLHQRLAHLTGPRDFSPRQQTLRGAIDWSYELLTEEEQSLFAHAALFLRGTAEALAQVWGKGRSSAEVETMLYALADKSLLQINTIEGENQPRFRLLHIMREYGLEQLQKQGVLATAQECYITYYTTWLESITTPDQVKGDKQQTTFAAIDAESDDWQEALYWASTTAADNSLCLRLCDALNLYWEARGQYREASRLSLLALAHSPSPSSLRAKVLSQVSFSLRIIGRTEQALSTLQESITIYEQRGDKQGLATNLHHLGQHYGMLFDYAQAADYFRRALIIYRQLAHPEGIALALGSIGLANLRLGQYEAAEAAYTESLEIREELRLESSMAHSLTGLAQVARARGNYAQAEPLLHRALHLRHRLGHRRHLANTLDALSQLWLDQGRMEAGLQLMGAVYAILDEIGVISTDPDRQHYLALGEAAVGPARAAQLQEEGATLTLDEVLALATAVLA